MWVKNGAFVFDNLGVIPASNHACLEQSVPSGSITKDTESEASFLS